MITPETKTAIEIVIGLFVVAAALAADLLCASSEMEDQDENQLQDMD